MESKKSAISRPTVIVLLVLSVGIVYWYTSTELRSFEEQIQANVDAAESQLIELAETTGNARVDEVAESIIQDCGGRVEYQTLMSSLDSLDETELLRVKDLYGDCSWRSPMIRLFMAHRLEVALAEFETQLELLARLKGDQSEHYQLAGWRSLVEKEKSRADLLRQQNSVQGRIIDTLVAGENERIPELLQEAQNINGTLNVTSIQINQERAVLTSE